MKALFPAYDTLKEAFLLFGWHYLVLAICVTLVPCKVYTQHIDEVTEREMLVLIQVEELLLKNPVVVDIF